MAKKEFKNEVNTPEEAVEVKEEVKVETPVEPAKVEAPAAPAPQATKSYRGARL